MKKILYITLLLSVIVLSGCKKEKSGWITPKATGLFVMEYDKSTSTTFSCSNISSFEPVYFPEGWIVAVSLKERTIRAMAPESADKGDAHGKVMLMGYDEAGNIIYVNMTVAVTEPIAINDPNYDRQANCMILTEPNKLYTFNPNRRGESSTIESTKATSCDIIWRTPNSPVAHPRILADGTLAIYTTCDYDDVDNDGSKDDLIEGNALVAAYDAAGNILWSWHLWTTESDPTLNPVSINGVDFLPRNLGAAKNKIGTNEDVLGSYGLYYQWGRKEPFIYPFSYNAAGSYDMTLYNSNGDYVSHSLVGGSQSVGTSDYALQNPLNFIMSEDWLYNSDDKRWSATGEKSIYDPSPKGWRVPSSEDFAQLTWTDENDFDYKYGYGTELSGELFMALGRKVYYDGSIQNVSGDGSFNTWAGYYWSCDGVSGGDFANSLYFYLDRQGTTDTADDSVVVEVEKTMQRGNGMQIRAVRDI